MIKFTEHEFEDLAEPRQMTERERAMLLALVDGSGASSSATCQATNARVSSECVHLCGSIRFTVDVDQCGLLELPDGLVANAEVRLGTQPAQDLLLFAVNGRIDHLETYREDGTNPGGLPTVGELTILTAKSKDR